MATSTLDVQALDRQNLLNMQASSLTPSTRYLLVYAAGGQHPDPDSIFKALEKSPDVYGFPPVVQVGNTIVVPTRTRLKPSSVIVEAVATPIKVLQNFPYMGALRLTHLLAYDAIVHPRTSLSESLQRTAVVASQSPKQRSDPLGIGALGQKLGDSTKKVLSIAKWVSLGIIAVIVLVVIGEVKGATR